MQQTSAVRSSIASAKRSAGIVPSASGWTWTTSAPRSSCACAIWPTVGNSYSLITIRFRSPSSRSADVSALTPWETDVVTATSSVSAWSKPAIAVRKASFRSTQKSHSAPFASQPVSHSSHGVPHPVRERTLRARVEVRRSLEDRELATDSGTDHRLDIDTLCARHGRLLYRLGGVVTPKNRATPIPAFRNECGTSDR